MIIAHQYGWMNERKYWKIPEEFFPQRFLKNANFNIPSSAFTPFGIGMRKCIGEKYAINILFSVFIRFIKKTNEINIKVKMLNQFFNPDKNKITIFSPEKY